MHHLGHPLLVIEPLQGGKGAASSAVEVMGQRLPQDVADYPHRRKRLYHYDGAWDLVDLEAVGDPR